MSGNPLNSYIRKRAQSMGWSMVVMGGSFFLYYLGLFGNVQGPLAPGNLGESLAAMGVEKSHMLMFFLSFFIIALTWNYFFNLISFMIGSRRSCLKKNQGHSCGAVTQKIKAGNKQKNIRYRCVKGHTCSDARFNPVKKGVVSHTIWVVAMVFCAIILYCS